MFICDKDKQQIYITYMEELKSWNRGCRKRRQELILRDWNQHIQKKAFLSSLRSRLTTHKSANSTTNGEKTSSTTGPWKEFPVANYFSEHRIAVYTCIIGAYDKLTEPKFKPDNIDYYVITDQPLPHESMWCFLDASRIKMKLSSLNATEQNRWHKMHPHLLFPNYDYSIYLDGNVAPVSDLTEFINRIGSCAIATHSHYIRNCVYQEAEAILQSGKDRPEHVKQHLRFLQEQGMPKEYGLADCSVIARKHHDTFCISLMEQWWKEFLLHSRRDQLSFPYVLFKNGLPMKDVTTLGSNRIFNDALDIAMHL
jgi:hypothetical protein